MKHKTYLLLKWTAAALGLVFLFIWVVASLSTAFKTIFSVAFIAAFIAGTLKLHVFLHSDKKDLIKFFGLVAGLVAGYASAIGIIAGADVQSAFYAFLVCLFSLAVGVLAGPSVVSYFFTKLKEAENLDNS